MQDVIILGLILIFVAAAFVMEWFRMHYTLSQDVNIHKKVNGLSIDMGKVKKALREGYTNVTTQTQGAIDVPADLLNMSLEDAAESIGFDKKDLNNPIVRPIAEKIFEGIKAKAAAQDQGEEGQPDITFI